MSWDQKKRRRVVAALKHDSDSSALTKRITGCSNGTCEKCGDLCPLKARLWLKGIRPTVVNAFGKPSAPLLKVRYTKPSWSRRPGELNAAPLTVRDKALTGSKADVRVNQQAIEKALRRAFDKLRPPAVLAVGMIDAWYGYQKWEMGVMLMVAGAQASDLYDAFPVGQFEIEKIEQPVRTLNALIRSSYQAKQMPPFGSVRVFSRARRREYYLWLAGMTAHHRLFRYGCDRYFNPIEKAVKARRPKVRKPRSWQQLVPHQFGNHPADCQCIPCGGLGKHYRRG